MSLQLILGGSGYGKSYHLYQEIIEKSMKNPRTNYIILVPEQFTMQTQKELVTMHPRKGIMNIDVLSFQRLAYRIFEEVGGNNRLVLEDTGKSMILRKIVGENLSEMKILGSNLKKTGYISEIKSMISELTQYDITTGQLDAIVENTENKPLLHAKLKDINLLYKRFKEYLKDKYITAEEILDVLSEVIDKSEFIKNSVIALDGFTGFTPIQNKLLEKLLILSKKVMVTVTIDGRENPYKADGNHKLFYLSKKTIHKLAAVAEEVGVKKEKDIVLKAPVSYRHKDSKSLGWLENYLFRYSREACKEEENAISLHVTKNPLEEGKYVGREIKKLIREKGYRYKDIAIITGDNETYSPYLEKIFNDYDIPCFIDHKRSILKNPFIEFIKAIIEVVDQDFSYDSVFRYLRSGIPGIPEDDIDILENYVIALGIRGAKKWSRTWERGYRGFEQSKLEDINRIRENVVEIVLPFRGILKNKESTVRDYTVGLYHFLVSVEMEDQLRKYEEYFLNQNEVALAKEYNQIYGIILDLLDKLVDLLGEEKLTLKEYGDILDAGFEQAKVGVIPPGIDQVIVGDIERTRLKDVKVLFFMGVNDGIIPGASTGGGIISELERETLAKEDIELAPTARENVFIQKFYLYLNLTKPTEALYLTFSKVNGDGKSLRPSYLIGSIKKLYENLNVIDEEEGKNFVTEIVTPQNGLDYLVEGLRDYEKEKPNKEWKELYTWYFNHESFREPLNQLIEAAFYENKENTLSKSVAKALYGTFLENSVTRLEKFASCAFAHFLQYGLELEERVEFSFRPMDMGNIFHQTLERFSKILSKTKYTWFDLPDEDRDKMVETALDGVILEYNENLFYSSARNEYMINRMKRIMKRTTWALSQQVRAGAFTPSNYEISFSQIDHLDAIQISLSEDEKMKLHGRIDRIDKYENDETAYIKIIDYKSGEKKFDLISLYYGLQLQLVVYLNAAVEMEKKSNPGKEVIPAGIFYYNINDPMVEKEENQNGEEIDKKIREKLRMEGLVNSDLEVIKLLDHTGEKKSYVIPVSFNKDGIPTKYSSVATKDQFSLLAEFVNDKIKEIGSEIVEGNISVKPYESGDSRGCDYCPYGAVCGFDRKIPGFEFKRLKKEAADIMWEKIKNKENKEDIENKENHKEV